MEDFNIFDEDDKNDVSYGACVAGSAITGAAVGRILGVQGLLGGAAAGLVIGLIACKSLKEPIKDKIFSPLSKLSESELTQALIAVKDETGIINKKEAMLLLGVARNEYISQPLKFSRRNKAPMSMKASSDLILKNLSQISS